jgi:hypothetical protein
MLKAPLSYGSESDFYPGFIEFFFIYLLIFAYKAANVEFLFVGEPGWSKLVDDPFSLKGLELILPSSDQ